jgi:hypothetical protein
VKAALESVKATAGDDKAKDKDKSKDTGSGGDKAR